MKTPWLPREPVALGRGGKGNNKKVEQQEDRPTGLAKAPVSAAFPAPHNRSGDQEAGDASSTGTSNFCPSAAPPAPREGGRAGQERQNPAFDQPPSATHYAREREDQATCFLTESNKNIGSKTLTAKTTPLVGSLHCDSDPTGASILSPPSSSHPPPTPKACEIWTSADYLAFSSSRAEGEERGVAIFSFRIFDSSFKEKNKK